MLEAVACGLNYKLCRFRKKMCKFQNLTEVETAEIKLETKKPTLKIPNEETLIIKSEFF